MDILHHVSQYEEERPQRNRYARTVSVQHPSGGETKKEATPQLQTPNPRDIRGTVIRQDKPSIETLEDCKPVEVS